MKFGKRKERRCKVMKKRQTTVKIDEDIVERIHKISSETGMKEKAIINTALRVYLDEFEKSLDTYKTIVKLKKE